MECPIKGQLLIAIRRLEEAEMRGHSLGLES
jgi:hypothetical protein